MNERVETLLVTSLSAGGDRVRVTIESTRGSVPRDAGTSMIVHDDRIDGTIGGGALEWNAMATARAMISDGPDQMRQTVPLGPALGQCCGGSVTLAFERLEGTGDRDAHGDRRAPLWIWGAGHVGRALVSVLAPLQDREIMWIDMAEDRFPASPDGVDRLVAREPAGVATRAPVDACHIIVTHSHEIDLALCHALLGRRTGWIGLIGSATKWARFRSRLRALGHRNDNIDRIRCPIGRKELGKHPQAIAVGVAAGILAAETCAGGTTG